MRWCLRLTAAAVALLLAFCGSSCRQRTTPPNLLVIVGDALRADVLGAYGSPRQATPTLDLLAQRSLRFRRAYAVSSWTHPSVAAMFSGRPPTTFQPGAPQFLAADHPTLAEVLRRRGYRTAAFVANPMMAPELGFGRGFEVYRGYGPWVSGLAPLESKAPASTVVDEALAWIAQQDSARPWFAYIHFMDPHWPYEPSETHLARFWKGSLPTPEAVAAINQQVRARQASSPLLALARDLYVASVAEMDSAIARLLAALDRQGLTSRTVVCLTSDHGEEFGEHGGVLHARTLYEEVIHVPLLLFQPGTSPREEDAPASTVHLAPTLLAALGQDPSPFPGAPLQQSAHQAAPAVRAELFPFPPAMHHWAVIERFDKLLRTTGGEWELYDLASDPRERRNRAALAPAVIQRLETLARPPVATPQPIVDEAQRERMRALGYDF